MTPKSSLLALALSITLAACAVSQPYPSSTPTAASDAVQANSPATRPLPASTALKPGLGVVESASVASLPSSSGAAAGASAGPTIAYRLRMEDGSTQNLLRDGERLDVGDRVEVTSDGRLVGR